MKLFDTHCHFETCDTEEVSAILLRAKEAGVESLTAVGGSEDLNKCALFAAELAAAKEGMPLVKCALGYDRGQTDCARPDIPADAKLAAWGEIGLDYREDTSELEKAAQRKPFSQQLQLAAELKLPVSIHCRGAADDVLSIVAEYGSKELMAENRLGVVHCFTEDIDFATKSYGMGLYFGISGIVTFRNADLLRSTVSKLPIERILIETDCPYLSPVPMRGKPCEPAFARYTAECVAGLHGLDVEAFGEISTANARKLFAL
jgi:TatD DNase family protein